MYLLENAWNMGGWPILFVSTTQTATREINVHLLMGKRSQSIGQVCHICLAVILRLRQGLNCNKELSFSMQQCHIINFDVYGFSRCI